MTASPMTDIPTAVLKPSRHHLWLWFLLAGIVILVGWLVWRQLPEKGALITIEFNQVSGVNVGQTELRYRGVTVGRVESLMLGDNGESVKVTVQTQPNVQSLLKADTTFWLVQPKIGAQGVKGIKTLVSGPYISMRPGNGEPTQSFTALSSEPLLRDVPSVQVQVVAKRLHGIVPGDVIYYKSAPVGRIYAYQLTSDNVIFSVQIDQPYAALLRKNSVFWEQSGFELEASLLGVSMSTSPMMSLLRGGLSFATPEEYTGLASDGDRYTLAEDKDDDWLDWQPVIALPDKVVLDESDSPTSKALIPSGVLEAPTAKP